MQYRKMDIPHCIENVDGTECPSSARIVVVGVTDRVSVIFRLHGQRIKQKLCYFPSLSLILTLCII